jgi:hypothetical protein
MTIDSTVQTVQHPSVYVEGDHTFYRASALGSCPRALYAHLTGNTPVPYPPNVLKAFARGNDNEQVVIDQLKSNGFVVTGQQREVNLPITDHISVIGHIDGLLVRPSVLKDVPLALLEVKVFSQETLNLWYSKKLAGFPHYSWQVSAYLHALHLDYCVLVIMNADEPDISKRLKMFKLPNPHLLSDIQARIFSVQNAVEHHILPQCETDSFFCPFPYMHDKKEATDNDVEVNPDLASVLAKYYEATRSQKQLGDFVQLLRKQILGYNILSGHSDLHSLHVSQVNSTILDREKLDTFLTANNEEYSHFTKKAASQRLEVKEIK